MTADAWEEIKSEIANGKYVVVFTESGIPGTQAAVCTHARLPMPVGIVWYRYVGNQTVTTTIELLHSFVVEKLRRCGIRTAIHTEMAKHFAYILTGGGNDASHPWLEKMGFTKAVLSGNYVYTRPDEDAALKNQEDK